MKEDYITDESFIEIQDMCFEYYKKNYKDVECINEIRQMVYDHYRKDYNRVKYIELLDRIKKTEEDFTYNEYFKEFVGKFDSSYTRIVEMIALEECEKLNRLIVGKGYNDDDILFDITLNHEYDEDRERIKNAVIQLTLLCLVIILSALFIFMLRG